MPLYPAQGDISPIEPASGESRSGRETEKAKVIKHCMYMYV